MKTEKKHREKEETKTIKISFPCVFPSSSPALSHFGAPSDVQPLSLGPTKSCERDQYPKPPAASGEILWGEWEDDDNDGVMIMFIMMITRCKYNMIFEEYMIYFGHMIVDGIYS